jgi:hypothetical protein
VVAPTLGQPYEPGGALKGTKFKRTALSKLRTRFEEDEMRTAFAVSVAVALSLPVVTIARADDVVIKKNEPSSTTVIKKKEEPRLLPVPHEEQKTIIKKEHDD